MTVAFIYDPGCFDGSRGGAELAMDELLEFAPVPLTSNPLEADTVVIGNCATVSPNVIPDLEGKTVWRYHHDLSRVEDPELRAWLDENAQHIFSSPLHRDLYRDHPDGHLIPPCSSLAEFKPNRQMRRHPNRNGACTVGSWQGPGKGARLLSELGVPLDCYGTGAFQPYGAHIQQLGPVDHSKLPAILWQYETFYFLPTVPEPFGRCVAEAWAAGATVITNDNVGAKYWIEHEPDKMFSAAQDFWNLVAP